MNHNLVECINLLGNVESLFSTHSAGDTISFAAHLFIMRKWLRSIKQSVCQYM